MESKFFTNKDGNTLLSKFDEVFKNNPNIYHFDVLIGYLRASGYFQLRPLLDKVSVIRILAGMDIDSVLAEIHKKVKDLFANSDTVNEQFEKSILTDIAKAKYNEQIYKSIEQFFDDIISKKVEVRVHPSRKLHAKVYIFTPENFTEKTLGGAVITGSSNLTYAALKENYEFNVQLNDPEDVWFAYQEFETLWKEAENFPVTSKQIEQIKDKSSFKIVTPFELYIKLLIEYFGEDIEYNPNIIGDLPEGYKKLSYQLDAVSQGFEMLLSHNGFFLADVVGLGKTIIATMIAKKFWLQNGVEKTKILVIFPPAIETSWKKAFKNFGLKSCTDFISNGSLNKILSNDKDYSNPTEYDLIIVDEAHKFRTHTTDSYEYLQRICKSKRNKQGNIKGPKKVMLISATPLNNSPSDLQNQIELFQDSKQSTLPITNLTRFFGPLIEEYKKIKSVDALDIDKLRNIYKEIRKNVIEPITIRRTRKDLTNTKEYMQDLKIQGLAFPKLHAPQKKEYSLSPSLRELFEKTVEYLVDVDRLTYSRYQAIAFLKPEIQAKYYDRAEMTSKSLAFIMKTNLVKRLESSFHSFKISLKTFEKSTKRMIDMFNNNKIYIIPDGDIMKMMDKNLTEKEIDEKVQELEKMDSRNRCFGSKDFEGNFIINLQKDLSLLSELCKDWKFVEEDPKLDIFLKNLKSEFLDKKINGQGKLVVFSESEDTIDYLDDKLKEKKIKGILKISAKNRDRMEQVIEENFDANYLQEKKNDYNIILTTEVLAEGVNLHRSNVVVHYDTPWNSVKLMQRIGRVNRIGGSSTDIYNYVFYPSTEGDKQIKLKKTALMKIQSFHSAFGEDNQVFSEDEILDEVKLFSENAFREDEDERLKYLVFLRKFKMDNRELFNKILNYPKKIRVGRCTANSKLQGSTLVFLKTAEKFEFYSVKNDNAPKEITVVEAFKIAKAEQAESSVDLPSDHYKHVELALEHFIGQATEAVRSVNEIMGKDAEARKFVLDMRSIGLNKELANKVAKLIEIGKLKDLTSKILKVKRKIFKNQNELLSALEKELSHGLDLFNEDILEKEYKEPELILSESFKE
jgi:ERCC4-related helicase/HKD family nuclease